MIEQSLTRGKYIRMNNSIRYLYILRRMMMDKGFEAKQIRHEKTRRLPYGLDYRTFPRLYKFSDSPPFCRKFFYISCEGT